MGSAGRIAGPPLAAAPANRATTPAHSAINAITTITTITATAFMPSLPARPAPPGQPVLPAPATRAGHRPRLLAASRTVCALLGGLGLLLALSAPAQSPAAVKQSAKPVAKAPGPAQAGKPAQAAKSATGPSAAQRAARNQAQGLALAQATTEAISAIQLDIAARVLTGPADCEFKQTVQVLALPGKPGLFSVEHQGRRFVMAPRETQTGAVRLEDPAAGVMWLQIPTKSMLMNARIGQRMVDSCLHAEQRIALTAVADAATALGIVPRAAEPPAAAASAPDVAASSPAVAASAAEPASAASAAASAALASAAAPAASAPAAPPAASAPPAAPPASAAPPPPAAFAPPAAPASAAAPAAPAASAASQ